MQPWRAKGVTNELIGLSSICFDLFGERSRQQGTLDIRNCIRNSLSAPSLSAPESLDRLDDTRDPRRVNRSTGHIDSPLHAFLAEDVIRRAENPCTVSGGLAGWC